MTPTLMSLFFLCSSFQNSKTCECNFSCFGQNPSPEDKTVPGMNINDPNYLQIDEETGCMCRAVPNVIVVCFGRTGCRKIPSKVLFKAPKFKITGSHIGTLAPGDFDRFPYLEGLQIEGNFNLTDILPGAFNRNLSKLTNLSISFNPRLRSIRRGIFEGLVNLREIFLIKNGFETLYDITVNLSPIYLPNLLKICLDENSFVTISNTDFLPMLNSSLEELNVVLCRIEFMDPDAFVWLKHLRVLRIGENNFDAGTMSKVIERSTEAGLEIKVLDLFSAGYRSLPKDLLQAVSESRVEQLNLARNQFSLISSENFPTMPRLLVLNLGEVLLLDIKDNAFSNLPNLQTLRLNGNKLPDIPRGVLMPHLRELDLENNAGGTDVPSYFSMTKGIFGNMSNLECLNLSFDNIYHLFNGSFIGLSNLRVLSLKNSSIYHIENSTFAPLKVLACLNLENNDFVRHNHPYAIWPDMFAGLDNLEVLLLGGCGISYFSLYSSPFALVKNLRHLGLQNNLISTISARDFAPLTKLRSLDLSNNFIKVWEARLFGSNQLNALLLHHNKVTYFTQAMLQDFSNLTELELSFNSFICKCFAYRIFAQWSKDNPNNTLLEVLQKRTNCIVPAKLYNYSVAEYFEGVRNHTIICDHGGGRSLLVVLPLALLLLCFVSLGISIYYYRWHIKYWMFLTRLYLSRTGKLRAKKDTATSYTNYTYDAFVSYSNEDRNFVVRLVSMLENYEPFLKLCVYERDFEVGSFISESVLEGVAKSRKTVLIVSDSYARSVWCRWESQIVEHHRLFFENRDGDYVDDSLVLVKLGPVSSNHLTPTLKYLLKTRIYLRWDSDDETQKVFWEKLRQALAPTYRHDRIVESTRM